MNPESSTPPLSRNADQASFIGLAKIMRMIFSGIDLAPLGTQLVARAEANSGNTDANAFMDLFTILLLRGNRELALSMQAQALELQQIYSVPSITGQASIRLLVLMGAGDLMANSPVELLLENSDVALDMLYVTPQRPLPLSLPAHDVLFVAIGESDENIPLLLELDNTLKSWPQPVLNMPGRIALLSRDSACALLKSSPGIVMPDTARISRQTLEQIGREEFAVATVLADGEFPLIARIVLIEGRPFVCHMAISSHWMIHYLNADMTESAEKRAEEERFMANFDEDFALRHKDAFHAIYERTGLDYLGIDCGETADGSLLIFEVDSNMAVHALDPVDLFPYKQPQMRKVFAAFHEILMNAMKRGL